MPICSKLHLLILCFVSPMVFKTYWKREGLYGSLNCYHLVWCYIDIWDLVLCQRILYARFWNFNSSKTWPCEYWYEIKWHRQPAKLKGIGIETVFIKCLIWESKGCLNDVQLIFSCYFFLIREGLAPKHDQRSWRNACI